MCFTKSFLPAKGVIRLPPLFSECLHDTLKTVEAGHDGEGWEKHRTLMTLHMSGKTDCQTLICSALVFESQNVTEAVESQQ